MNRLLRALRNFCLPVLSLTRTPGGRYIEWSSAFFDPVMDVCEKGVWFVGLLCFVLVIAGISLVVTTFYMYVIPYLWRVQHPFWFTVYLAYGHYLLLSISFHYFRGVYTDPGTAPKIPDFDPYSAELRRGWKVCHKCEGPKPPRAHHCRICNRCVLKMDHHCPWMFNCVGHQNHRYFMLFVIYMWMGTTYVVNCTWARVVVLMEIKAKFLYDVLDVLGMSESVSLAAEGPAPPHAEGTFVVMVFFICFGVTIALGILGGWNMYLISVSETTIEFYTNKKEAKDLRKEGKEFVNVYDYGCWNNWKVFLGIVNGRSFFRHVLLPSGHSPHHDGMDWNRNDVLSCAHSRTMPV